MVEDRTIVNPKAGESAFSSSGYALPSDGDVAGVDDSDDDDDDDDDDTKKVETNKVEEATPTTTATTTAHDTNSETTVTKKKDSTSASSSSTTSTTATTTATTNKKVEPSKPKKPKAGPTPASIAMLSYHEFTEKYSGLVEEFMVISSLAKSKEFLIQHGNILLQENASNYLLLASLEDE